MSRHIIDDDPLAVIEARPYCRKHAGNIVVNGETKRYWEDCDCEQEELLRQEIDRIFLEEYNALHDNFFHSEFEASRSASLKALSLIAQKVAEAVETELSYFADGALDMIPRSAVKDRLKQIRSK